MQSALHLFFSLNLLSRALISVLLFPHSLGEMGNCGSGGWGNLSKLSQLVSSRAGIRTQAAWLLNPST